MEAEAAQRVPLCPVPEAAAELDLKISGAEAEAVSVEPEDGAEPVAEAAQSPADAPG